MVIGRDDVTLMVGYRYTVQVNAITLYKFNGLGFLHHELQYGHRMPRFNAES